MSASLEPNALERLDEIGEADVLAGIPSFRNETTIAGVIAAVEAGLRAYLPDIRAVICVSDGGSSDRTREVASGGGLALGAPERLVFEYAGTPGKGSAVRAILDAAVRLGVRGCALFDADLRSITPAWVERLLGPVLRDEFHFVAPVYARHKHDGTITNALAYPVTAALYGARIRQPIGGEFGLSGALAGDLAARDVWDTDVARFGIDVWMTTTAVVEGHRLCQTVLGAKMHDARDPGRDLGPMFRQVVGTMFTLAGRHHARWAEVRGVETPPTFETPEPVRVEPVVVSVPRLVRAFADGRERHRRLWRRVLSDEAMAAVDRAAAGASENEEPVELEDEAWFTIVYDFLVAHAAGETGPLLDALIPLYFARTAGFVERTRDDTDAGAEARVEAAVDAAVATKPYLVERWADRGLATRDHVTG